jgi:hypothetical protein
VAVSSLPRVAVSSEAPPREEEALLLLPFSLGKLPSTTRCFSLLKAARAVVLKLERVFEPEASRLARQEPVHDKAYDDA